MNFEGKRNLNANISPEFCNENLKENILNKSFFHSFMQDEHNNFIQILLQKNAT